MTTAPTSMIGHLDRLAVRAIVQPGDVLLYVPTGTFGRAIAVKTWSAFSHCELYIGESLINHQRLLRRVSAARHAAARQAGAPLEVWGSRDPERWLPRPSGGGVQFYPLRTSELALIRRPRDPIDLDALLAFCGETCGQAYDWWGLMRFFTVGRGKQDRMFCSEALTRAQRAAGADLFDNIDADQVSPGMLEWTRDLYDVWRKDAR